MGVEGGALNQDSSLPANAWRLSTSGANDAYVAQDDAK